MVGNVPRLEFKRVLRVVVVAVLADLDQRAGDQWLEQDDAVLALDRV